MLTEDSPMPYGKFAGTPLKDLPPDYVRKLWHGMLKKTTVSSVGEYFRNNRHKYKL